MSGFLELFQATGIGLVLMLPLANPLTAIALMLGLSGKMSKSERNQQSMMAAVYVFIVMTVTFYIGQAVMTAFGISLPGLRIAGGLIVAFIGFTMLFPKEEEDAPELSHKQEELEHKHSANIAFVPLTMPGTAGPGTIAMIISAASTIDQNPHHFSHWVLTVAPLSTFLVLALLLWVGLISAGGIMKLLGKGGISAISRLMGFLLVCMGIQFVINGTIDIVHHYQATVS